VLPSTDGCGAVNDGESRSSRIPQRTDSGLAQFVVRSAAINDGPLPSMGGFVAMPTVPRYRVGIERQLNALVREELLLEAGAE
jgi:hypothetical protein